MFGELAEEAIIEGALVLAKEKAQLMPVILFCLNEEQCHKLKSMLHDSKVFAGENAGT